MNNDALDHSDAAQRYTAVQESDEFVDLRRRFRRFVFPLTAVFLAWYFLYVLLSTFAVGFMSTKVWGEINVGLVFGLLQFVSTFTITTLYVRHCNNNTDPIADELRDRLEGGELGA